MISSMLEALRALTEEKEYKFAYFASWYNASLVCTSIINPDQYKTICINDTAEEEDKQRIDVITKHFNSQFPSKCKYER